MGVNFSNFGSQPTAKPAFYDFIFRVIGKGPSGGYLDLEIAGRSYRFGGV
jgi:hypothetical protein